MELNKKILNFYLQAHDIHLTADFFDETKDYTYRENGHILFERKADKDGATIRTFDARGHQQYEVLLDKEGTRLFKKYHQAGIPKIEENPDALGTIVAKEDTKAIEEMRRQNEQGTGRPDNSVQRQKQAKKFAGKYPPKNYLNKKKGR